MSDLSLEDRVELLEIRLRQVLATLVFAPIASTTTPSDQGAYEGHDQFIGVGLVDEAEKLLGQWDEEDAPAGGANPEEKL